MFITAGINGLTCPPNHGTSDNLFALVLKLRHSNSRPSLEVVVYWSYHRATGVHGVEDSNKKKTRKLLCRYTQDTIYVGILYNKSIRILHTYCYFKRYITYLLPAFFSCVGCIATIKALQFQWNPKCLICLRIKRYYHVLFFFNSDCSICPCFYGTPVQWEQDGINIYKIICLAVISPALLIWYFNCDEITVTDKQRSSGANQFDFEFDSIQLDGGPPPAS